MIKNTNNGEEILISNPGVCNFWKHLLQHKMGIQLNYCPASEKHLSANLIGHEGGKNEKLI